MSKVKVTSVEKFNYNAFYSGEVNREYRVHSDGNLLGVHKMNGQLFESGQTLLLSPEARQALRNLMANDYHMPIWRQLQVMLGLDVHANLLALLLQLQKFPSLQTHLSAKQLKEIHDLFSCYEPQKEEEGTLS